MVVCTTSILKKRKTIKKKFERMCVVCVKKIINTLYSDRTYPGGYYFNIKIPRIKQEYWECSKCFHG